MQALAAGKKYPFYKVDIQNLMYHYKFTTNELACESYSSQITKIKDYINIWV